MEHQIMLNPRCLPIPRRDAYVNFYECMQGVLALNTGDDRFAFMLDAQDGTSFLDSEISDEYTMLSFVEDLRKDNGEDLALFILEADDKTPAFDYIIREYDPELEFVAGGVFYIKGQPFEESGDFIPLALVSGAILVSPSKNPLWDSHLLRVGKFVDGGRDEEFSLYNIASCEHGKCLNDIFRIRCRVSIKDSFPACHFSSEFIDWCNGLSDGDRLRVVDRIRMADSLGFVGSPPLLKRLVNAEGLWEIRAFAVTSGWIRMLYSKDREGPPVLLVGWIKKGLSDGYEANIALALRLLAEFRTQQLNWG